MCFRIIAAAEERAVGTARVTAAGSAEMREPTAEEWDEISMKGQTDQEMENALLRSPLLRNALALPNPIVLDSNEPELATPPEKGLPEPIVRYKSGAPYVMWV